MTCTSRSRGRSAAGDLLAVDECAEGHLSGRRPLRWLRRNATAGVGQPLITRLAASAHFDGRVAGHL